MRVAIVSFLLGAVIGAATTVAIFRLTRDPAIGGAERAAETLDFLIDQWTAERDVTIAGIPARLELPDARSGFFPDTVRALARHVEQTYGVPSSVTLAQWALESSWGRKNLGASNFFGHTYAAVRALMERPAYITMRERVMRDGRMAPGDTVYFASYQNIAECFDVHGKYLSRSERYKRAFRQTSPEGFAREMARRYATDPDYGLKIIAIMRRYEL